jgi:hypothetical protein
MQYRLLGWIEFTRLALRASDFVILIIKIVGLRHLSLFSLFKEGCFYNYCLVECGPGPCKLNWLKQIIFRGAMFYDLDDYGQPSPNLICVNLEEGIPCVPMSSPSSGLRYLYFADHCFEHLPFNVVLDFVTNCDHPFLFRVPNIRSSRGLKDYLADPTHKSMFTDDQLMQLCSIPGVQSTHWNRFYSRGLGRAYGMERAREICIYRIQPT